MSQPTANGTDDLKKVLYYEILSFQPGNIELLKSSFDFRSLPNPDCDTPEELKRIDAVFAPLGYFWGREKIDWAPNLKVIASNTTGTPHIDTEYAEKRGIRVISLKDQADFLKSITPTAELTWGLILSLVRRIPWAFDSVCRGNWNRRLFGSKKMLSNMTLGIVGMGRLGEMVARCGVSFGMKIQYFTLNEKGPDIPQLIRVPTLEELVATSDIVTLHIPLEERNEKLFDKRIFSLFKEGAYLINTSRGEIIDSEALLDYLKVGRLAGAALDVMEGEFERDFPSRLKHHHLIEYAINHDNLLITPHIGGSTLDAWQLTEEYAIKAVLEVLAEQPLLAGKSNPK